VKPDAESELISLLRLEPDHHARLRVFEAAVRKWSSVKNLVSGPALDDLWVRHILDSAQVQRAVPDANVWADLGSGGGFPGIVTAILLAGRADSVVHLVESDGRKCAFLRAVSRETGVRTCVHHGRIENVADTLSEIEAVSARALADMNSLVAWADPLLQKGATGVFPKGRSVHNELTRLATDSRFEVSLRPSISDPESALVLVRRNFSPEQTSEKF
jgi:16S rRNA (guanine527-N7)-methyltransferase